jgi:hypothetical protein
VLSALPLVGAFNACCCLWIVSGGAVSAYLLQQSDPEPIEVGDGAIAGLLAGLVGAFVNLVISIPVTLLMAPVMQRWIDLMSEQGMPPEFREMIGSGVGSAVGIVVGFVFSLVAGVIFSTLGGVLGALIFRRPPPPAPPVINSQA